ncbi:uncharacterized protein BT62DRAFT_927251 [Guyanagaster necrorhizus]|uniref:Uncharacterized protein n=1 Tax=Guyanagaster necrorhizus TaxID=856835 RepID=A0A9P7W589_9AGAR|nr:uncharacterized protein BT62DRAFT_927251 [Guyanagaster necrorhizus MCA 3950]KAG7451541.1 hypothetical protein BT62DRAFT_927251 [Guyanagaster necrorhizus MCA 3950]
MSIDISVNGRPIDKGKGRAVDPPTECTPLIPHPSSSPSSSVTDIELSHVQSRRTLLYKLLYVFFISLLLCTIAVVGLALLAWSYAARASDLSPDAIINDGLVFEGPSRVDVLNMTDTGGIWTRIEGRIGLDAGGITGMNSDDQDNLMQDLWKSLGRWGIRKLDRVSVSMSSVHVVSAQDERLASLTVPSLEIALTLDPPADLSWLQPVSMTVFIQPTTDGSVLKSFVQEAWREGAFTLKTDVGEVAVEGGDLGGTGWRHNLRSKFTDVNTVIKLIIPRLPGLPQPGRNVPFPPLADLITLESFSVMAVNDELTLEASATIIDPAPLSFNLSLPPLPFVVSLPPDVPIATVMTKSFTTTHPNIILHMTGSVLPLPSGSSSVLSTFLSRYLSALPNPISISTPLVSHLSVEAIFPGPQPQPKVLRNVTIHDMKIKPRGSNFLASGTVFARVVLPKGMDIELDVSHVLPDVLVFDGEPPQSNTVLPDPLPEHAFAHIQPDEWLRSWCAPAESDEDGGSAFAVSAKMEDVPLEVLPGRQKAFSNFVSKVIFGADGALAGLVGTVAVRVDVPGLPSEDDSLQLDGLPFQGSVRIGKKSTFFVD